MSELTMDGVLDALRRADAATVHKIAIKPTRLIVTASRGEIWRALLMYRRPPPRYEPPVGRYRAWAIRRGIRPDDRDIVRRHTGGVDIRARRPHLVSRTSVGCAVGPLRCRPTRTPRRNRVSARGEAVSDPR